MKFSALVSLIALILAPVIPAAATQGLTLSPAKGTGYSTSIKSPFVLEIDQQGLDPNAELHVVIDDPSNGLEMDQGAQYVFDQGVRHELTKQGQSWSASFESEVRTVHPGGLLTTDTVFSAVNSPYEVLSTVEIKSGVTVTIEPGVVIYFSGNTGGFWVHGNLLVQGTQAAPVKIGGLYWNPVFNFENAESASVVVEHAHIDGSYRSSMLGYTPWGSISFTLTDSVVRNLNLGWASGNNAIRLERNQFINSAGLSGYFDDQLVQIIDNSFSSTFGPVINFYAGSPTIRGNDFSGVTGSAVVANYSDLDVQSNWWGTTDPQLIEAKITDGKDSLAYSGIVDASNPLLAPSENSPPIVGSNYNPEWLLEDKSDNLLVLNPAASATQSFSVTVTVFQDLNMDGSLNPGEPASVPATVTFLTFDELISGVSIIQGSYGSDYVSARLTFAGGVNLRQIDMGLFQASFTDSSNSFEGSAYSYLEQESDPPSWIFSQRSSGVEDDFLFQILDSEQNVIASSTKNVVKPTDVVIEITQPNSAAPGDLVEFRIALKDDEGNPIIVTENSGGFIAYEMWSQSDWVDGVDLYTNENGVAVLRFQTNESDSGAVYLYLNYYPEGWGSSQTFLAETSVLITDNPDVIQNDPSRWPNLTVSVRNANPGSELTVVPISGASVSTYWELPDSGLSGSFTQTDETGIAELGQVAPLVLTVFVSAPGFKEETLSVDMRSGDQTIAVALEPYPVGNSSLTVRVTDSNGLPLANESGAYLRLDGDFSYFPSLDSSGQFTINNLPETSAWFTVWKTVEDEAQGGSWSGSYRETITIGPGANLIEIQLPGPEDRTLTGQVLGDASGLPIPGAIVKLSAISNSGPRGVSVWYETVTDASGFYSFNNLPPHVPGLQAQVEVLGQNSRDFESRQFRFILGEGNQELDIEVFEFSSGTNSLGGIVLDSETRTPLQGFDVTFDIGFTRADGESGYLNQTATTDYSGGFSLEDLPAGSRVLTRIYDPESNWTGFEFTTNFYGDDEARYFEVLLRQRPNGAAEMIGIVVDDEGSPIQGASVSLQFLRSASGENIQGLFGGYSAQTDENGLYSFTGLPAGEFSVSVGYQGADAGDGPDIDWDRAAGGTLVTIETIFDAVENDPIVVPRFETGTSSLQGVLWNTTDGTPVTGTYVKLWSNTANYRSFPVATDSQGRFLFENLPPGEYRVDPYGLENFFTPDAVWVVVSGNSIRDVGRIDVREVGPPEASAQVLVRDEKTLLPVAGANVYLSMAEANGQHFDATTNADGLAFFDLLPVGLYRLSGWAPGKVDIGGSAIGAEVLAGVNVLHLQIGGEDISGQLSGYVEDQFGNRVSDVEVSASFGIRTGPAEGDGYGKSAVSDSNGYFKLDGLPLDQDLTLNARAQFRNVNLVFNPDVIRFTESQPSSELTIVMTPGSSVSGLMSFEGGKLPSGLSVRALDPAGKDLGFSAEVQADGRWEISGLQEGDYKFAVSQWGYNGNVSPIASGYVKRVSASSAVLVTDFDEAETFALIEDSTRRIPAIGLESGLNLDALVSLQNQDGSSLRLGRSLKVDLYFRASPSAEFKPFSPMGEIIAWHRYTPQLSVTGLPLGEYAIKFSDPWSRDGSFAPVFHDGKSELSVVEPIVLSSSGNVEINPITLPIQAPSTPAPTVTRSALSEVELASKKDRVVPVIAGESVRLLVGTDFVGQYVSVNVTPEVRVSNLSTSNLTSQWRLVDGRGFVEIPLVTSGEIFVLTSRGSIVGWTTLSVNQGDNESGSGESDGNEGGQGSSNIIGGGGGGGGFFPMPVTPEPITTSPIPAGAKFGAVDADGNPVAITPTPAEDKRSMELVVGDAKLSLSANSQATFQEDGKILFAPKAPLAISASGYQPDSTVAGFLVPTSALVASNFAIASESVIELGTTTVTQDGSFTFAAELTAPAGSYLLQLTGTAVTGQTVTIAIEILVTNSETKSWAKRMAGNEAKLYAKNLVGAGKVTFMLNGEEIAWVRAADETDPKLRVLTQGHMSGTNYLVRTIKLQKGKNILEVYIDGERTTRVSYSTK